MNLELTIEKLVYESLKTPFRISTTIAGTLAAVGLFASMTYQIAQYKCDSFLNNLPKPNTLTEVIDAYPANTLEQKKAETKDMKMALAVVMTHELQDRKKDFAEQISKDLENLGNVKAYTLTSDNLLDMLNNIRDYSLVKPIDSLILVFHGDKQGLNLDSAIMSVPKKFLPRIFEEYNNCFASDATILIYSCNAGAEGSTAEVLATSLDREVEGPVGLIAIPTLRVDQEGNPFKFEKNKIHFNKEYFTMFKIFQGHMWGVPWTSKNIIAPREFEEKEGNITLPNLELFKTYIP